MQVDVNAWLGAGASLVVVVGGIAGALLWFRRWVRAQVATPVQAAAKQLETSNGTTVAGYVERLVADVAEVRKEQAAHAASVAAAAEQAAAALTLARHAHERLDAHLHGHP